MFVTLCSVEAKNNGIFGGILNILTKPKPCVSAESALKASYGVITVHEPLTAPDWKRVYSLAGRYGDRILLPVGITPPESYIAPRFPRFERQLLLNTTLEIIRLTKMPMYRRVIGLIDRNGEYADFLFPLLHHFTAVKVLTGKSELYAAYADKMMYELGAPVIISEDYASMSDCVLLLAPDGISVTERLGCPVISKKQPETRQLSDFITDLRLHPPIELARLSPDGIDPHSFFAAMYEFCGVDSAGLVAGLVTWRYRRTDLSSVVTAVMQAAGTLSLC